MAGDFKRLLFGLVLFTLFTSLILTFAINLGDNYGVSSDSIGGGSLNLSSFDDSIEDVESKSDSYRQRFEEGDVDNTDDAGGIFSVVTDMISLITTPFTLLAQVLSNVIPIPTIVISVMLGLISVALILSIWSLIKKGD